MSRLDEDSLRDEALPEVEQSARTGGRKLLVFVLVAVPLFLFIQVTPVGEMVHNRAALYALLGGGGVQAGLYFVLLTAALMAVGTPRLLFYALAGFIFGFWNGLPLAVCGSLIGSYLAFRVARWAGREWLVQRFAHRPMFRRVAGTKSSVTSVALMRCLPLSNLIINLAFAVSSVRDRVFLLGTLIGFLPQGVIAVLVGAGVADDVAWEGVAQLSLAALLALALMGVGWRQHRTRKNNTRMT